MNISKIIVYNATKIISKGLYLSDKKYYSEMSTEEREKLTSEERDKLQNEEIEALVIENEAAEQKSIKINKQTSLLIKFMFYIFMPLYVISIIFLLTRQDYISKVEIHNTLITSINNGATLEVVKNIYSNKEILPLGILKRILGDRTNYYRYDVPLSKILSDIQAKYYFEKNDIDINKINDIIKAYLIANPFDALESSQKDMFTDIRLKLKEEDYLVIQGNLEKISNELVAKNSLVNQYLKDSTNSFWISISALIFSLLIGSYQLYTGREKRQREILAEELSNHHK